MELSCDASIKISFETFSVPESFIYVKKQTLGILTASHQGITTYWNNVYMLK
jgi:hypothetical protein